MGWPNNVEGCGYKHSVGKLKVMPEDGKENGNQTRSKLVVVELLKEASTDIAVFHESWLGNLAWCLAKLRMIATVAGAGVVFRSCIFQTVHSGLRSLVLLRSRIGVFCISGFVSPLLGPEPGAEHRCEGEIGLSLW